MNQDMEDALNDNARSDLIYSRAYETAASYVLGLNPRSPEAMQLVLAVLMQECAKGMVTCVGTDEALATIDVVRDIVAKRMERKPHWFDRPDQPGKPT